MKEGWKYVKIKDVGDVVGGTTPSTTNPNFWNGSLCWISPAELQDEHYIYDSVKKITEEAVKSKSLKLLPEGTVILSSRAPIGKVAINRMPTYCNQGFKCVICHEELLNEFLYWWFWGNTKYLNSLGTGATFKEISKKVVENIEIPLPPLTEQERIVSYLDSAFAKIDALKKNAEKMLDEAKALFAAALKEDMTPQEGWEEKNLLDCASLSTGKYDANHAIENGKYRFYTCSSSYTFCNTKRFSGFCIILPGNGVNVGEVFMYDGEFDAYQRTYVLSQIKSFINQKYIYYHLKYDWRNKGVKKQFGAATNYIKLENFKNYSLFLPPLDLQRAIVAHLDKISAKVRRLEENYRKTIAECDAMKQAILRETFE